MKDFAGRLADVRCECAGAELLRQNSEDRELDGCLLAAVGIYGAGSSIADAVV